MDRKRKADGLLGAAVVVCLLSAPCKEAGFLFGSAFHISFAAAVGGFADWFAVSSLFGKPLGIPYRTDIVASRRDKIVEMAREMVAEELLTEKRIREFFLSHIPSDVLLFWLRNHRESLLTLAESVIHCGLASVDREWLWKLVAEKGEETVRSEDWAGRLAFVLYALRNYEGRDLLAGVLAREVRGFLRNEFTLTEVRSLYLKAWEKYKEHGWFRGVLQRYMADEEEKAVSLLQENIVRLADSIEDPESEVRRAIGAAYDGFIRKLTEDEPFRQQLNAWAGSRISELLRKKGKEICESAWAGNQEKAEHYLAELLLRVAEEQLSRPEKKKVFDDFLVEVCLPRIPAVHRLISESVVRSLEAYDGRRMAEMAKDGVQQDVQAIRINGSLFGGVLGLLFYLLSWAGGGF